jgi:hypothetical protein
MSANIDSTLSRHDIPARLRVSGSSPFTGENQLKKGGRRVPRSMSSLHFYADGSGHPDYRPPFERGDTDHYCIAGLLLNSGQREQIETRFDQVVQNFFPDREPRTVELKATWVVAHSNIRPPWDTLPGPRRVELFDQLRDRLTEVNPVLFGQVTNKEGYRIGIRASRPERPATNALRFLLGRLDRHLVRLGEHSTITLDEDSAAMQEAQLSLEASVRLEGDRLGRTTEWSAPASRLERIFPIHHLGSNQSRCLQAADLVAHWLWQAAEYGKSDRLRELDRLWAKFDHKREPWTAFLESSRKSLLKS